MIYNEQTEQNILGAIFCLNGYGEAVEESVDLLSVTDFYSMSHKAIFGAMKDLVKRGTLPDVNAVSDHPMCKEHFMYILEVARNTSSGLNLRSWTKQLRKITELRLVQDRVNSINEIISSQSNVTDKLEEIEQIFSLETGIASESSGAKHISDCMPEYIDRLEKRWTNPDEVLFTTGIRGLDIVLDGGLEVGLHAIAARPKMGKTEIMGKMINHFAVKRGLPVYVGSLEMPDFQVIERLVSSYGRIDKSQIKNNFKDEQDYGLAAGAFNQSCGDVGYSDIYIHDESKNTPLKIRREARKIQKKHGRVGGIFVDYLGLLDADGKHDRHDLSIASITKSFKAMSKEFNCPVIMLLQLNRGLESRGDKRPMPSDSRDSGAIEQDVDTWTAIYRDSVYKPESHWQNVTEIIVRLNRHGGTGTAYQKLTGAGFSDVSEEEVARLIHLEETKQTSNNTGNF